VCVCIGALALVLQAGRVAFTSMVYRIPEVETNRGLFPAVKMHEINEHAKCMQTLSRGIQQFCYAHIQIFVLLLMRW